MLDSIHAGTHQHLQLGEGVLLRGFDLDAAVQSGDPAAALAEALEDGRCLIGATKDGCVFRCVPAMLDLTRGRRTPADGETLAGRWEVTLSGTLLEISPDNAALLLNVPLFVNTGSIASITPIPTPVPSPAEDICWVGSTGSGMLAIRLECPISTGGMVFRISRNGLGETAFTLMAQKRDPASPALPCRLVWLKGAEL